MPVDVSALKAKLEALSRSLSIPPFGLTLRREREGKSLEGFPTKAYVNRSGPYVWFGSWAGSEANVAEFSEAIPTKLRETFPALSKELGNVGWLELVTRFAPAERDFATAGSVLSLPLDVVGLSLQALKPLQKAEAAAVAYRALVNAGVIDPVATAFIPDSPKGTLTPEHSWFTGDLPADNEHFVRYRAELQAIG